MTKRKQTVDTHLILKVKSLRSKFNFLKIFFISVSSLSLFISLLNFLYYKEKFNDNYRLEDIKLAEKSTFDYTRIIEDSMPAVVSIRVTKLEDRKYGGSVNLNEDLMKFFGNNKDNLLDQLMPEAKIKKRKVIVGGSGFFVSEDGIVVTNYHVVSEAKKIEIEYGHDNFIEAKVLGSDPMKDIAVIKADLGGKKSKILKFGDSDSIKIGDVILAIGSPFNLNGTVTSGIISSKSRKLGGIFDDFIQTDASINSGNSGGPMINLNGDVIGMNTAIISPNGANVGLGFAIPSNIIIATIQELKNKKDIKRGKIGIVVQKIDERFQDALKIKQKNLPIVVDIEDSSPAKLSGIEIGDIIVEIDNQIITSYDQVAKIISSKNLNDTAMIKINRYGQTLSFKVNLMERKFENRNLKNNQLVYINGIGLKNIDDSVRNILKIDKKIEGIIILDITNDNIIEEGLLERGDIILKINGINIKNIKEFQSTLNKIKTNYVIIEINKNGLIQLIPISIH